MEKPFFSFFDDIKNISYEQAYQYFNSCRNLLYYFITEIKNINDGKLVYVYRARVCGENEKTISNISLVKCREASKITAFGRINKPHQPIFYASGEANTCIAEIDTQIKDKFKVFEKIDLYVGQWKINRSLNIVVIPDWNNPEMKQFIDYVENNEKINNEKIILLKKVNDIFIQNDDNSKIHQITSAFCNVILDDTIRSKMEIDGFLYTSVKNAKGYNLGLFPHMFNNQDIELSSLTKTPLFKDKFDPDVCNFGNYVLTKDIDMFTGEIIWV